MSNFLKRQIIRHTRQIVIKDDNLEAIKEQLPKNAIIDNIVDKSKSKKIFIKLVTYHYYRDTSYNDLVNGMVREKYTESEEFAILRKSVNGINKEFIEYNTYVEECKVKSKEFIREREAVLNGNIS